jgi:hypothetical protein
MPNLLSISTGLALVAALGACSAAAGEAPLPPVLQVTSPARGLLQDHAGQVRVTGTAAPNEHGDAIETVLVNNVHASLQSDGTFDALIDVPEGATLIQTVARDARGGTASDTRAVQAGALHAVGTTIPSAVTAAMSADAFAKISSAAGPILQSLDLAAMLAPLQPMVHGSDSDGPDCLFAQLFVDDITFSDVEISLSPVAGGLAFRAELDDLAVPGHVRYKVGCFGGTITARVTVDQVVVQGTLTVAPNGTGFTTELVSPKVSLTHFEFHTSGLPDEAIDLLHLETAIQPVLAKAAELAMSPLMDQALGALAAPITLDVLGRQLEVQVAPSTVAFAPAGAVVAMNLKVLLAGGAASPGFIYTANGSPAMDPGDGFQLGIADDLANEIMAEALASGMLDLALPEPGGAFDAAEIRMTLPPMISASAADGRMHVVLGDMLATYTRAGGPVAKVAINASVDLRIASVGDGTRVALELGKPEIHVDVLDDVANLTGVNAQDLANASTAVLGVQIDTLSKLLVGIPIPAIAGLQMRDLSIGADDGYVMVRGRLE